MSLTFISSQTFPIKSSSSSQPLHPLISFFSYHDWWPLLCFLVNPLWFLSINKGLLKPLLLRWISSECDIYHARFCWPICGTAVMAFLVNELFLTFPEQTSALRKVNARWTPTPEQYHLINELHWVSTKPHRSGLAAGDSQDGGLRTWSLTDCSSEVLEGRSPASEPWQLE